MEHCTITVCFEDPFWIGLYERDGETGYQVCKITFGAEPRDYEVYEHLLAHWRALRFSPVQRGAKAQLRKVNPKRARREAQRQLSSQPIGTKAQQALKLQREAQKQVSQEKGRREKEMEAERRFCLRQEKRRKKHKGH